MAQKWQFHSAFRLVLTDILSYDRLELVVLPYLLLNRCDITGGYRDRAAYFAGLTTRRARIAMV